VEEEEEEEEEEKEEEEEEEEDDRQTEGRKEGKAKASKFDEMDVCRSKRSNRFLVRQTWKFRPRVVKVRW